MDRTRSLPADRRDAFGTSQVRRRVLPENAAGRYVSERPPFHGAVGAGFAARRLGRADPDRFGEDAAVRIVDGGGAAGRFRIGPGGAGPSATYADGTGGASQQRGDCPGARERAEEDERADRERGESSCLGRPAQGFLPASSGTGDLEPWAIRAAG